MRSDAIQEVTVHRRRSLEGTESSDGYDGTYHQKKRSQSLTLPNSSAKVGVPLICCIRACLDEIPFPYLA